MKANKLIFLLGWIIMLGATALASWDTEEFEKSYSIDGNQFSIELDVDGGVVEITKNDRPNECYVYLRYSTENCDREVNFNQQRNHLEIRIDHDWMSHKDKEDSDHTKIIIKLPANPEIDLCANIKAGEIEFELGDLRLRNFALKNWAGDVTIDFQQPNRTELESFAVNVKIGETKIERLGNANFKEADINSGIGELKVDFTGEKYTNSIAHIDLDIGESTIIVPEAIGVKMKVSKFLFLSEVDYPDYFVRRGSYYYSDNYEQTNKNLDLAISSGIGELKVRIK